MMPQAGMMPGMMGGMMPGMGMPMMGMGGMAPAMFGRDIFLHKAQIGDLKVGAEVTFGVEYNKQGMPQARDLMTLDGRVPGPPPAGVVQGGKKNTSKKPGSTGKG